MREFFDERWHFFRGLIATITWIVFLRGFHFVVFMKAGKLRWDDTLIITGMYSATVAGVFWLSSKPRESI